MAKVPKGADCAVPVSPTVAMLDVDAVAALLSCSVRHVRRLADSGRMPASVRLGALVRWNRTDIESWITKGCPPDRTNSKTSPYSERRPARSGIRR